MSPTAKAFVQVKLATVRSTLAISCLKITQPIACYIYGSSENTGQEPSAYQYNPNLASINHLVNMAYETCSAGVKHPQSLTFLRIFEYPVNRSKIVIANSAARTLQIPIQRSTIFVAIQSRAVGNMAIACDQRYVRTILR